MAAHVIEHMALPQVGALLSALLPSAAFIQSPLTEEGQDWTGYIGSHVLRAGWREIVAVCRYSRAHPRPDAGRARRAVLPMMFNELVIETAGYCNRSCPTCLRNSHPDREALAYRFTNTSRMPVEMYASIVDQAAEMGFVGSVNIQFFDEPMADRRLASFGRLAKVKGVFSSVRCYSNGDLLTPELAAELDGAFDEIRISLYDEAGGSPLRQGRAEREELLRSWFHETLITYTGGGHIYTHYSPVPGLTERVAEVRGNPCVYDAQERMIIDHRGEMHLCCDDIMGEWHLGNVADMTLDELWNSQQHLAILAALETPGGRARYPYCWECPR